MTYTTGEIWLIILVMGVVTFLIRYSFLGLIGNRTLPEWVLRHLRYTPVAVLPGLVAPLVIWPAANGYDPEPARIIAALVALGMGIITKSVLAAILSGALTLTAGLYMLG